MAGGMFDQAEWTIGKQAEPRVKSSSVFPFNPEFSKKELLG